MHVCIFDMTNQQDVENCSTLQEAIDLLLNHWLETDDGCVYEITDDDGAPLYTMIQPGLNPNIAIGITPDGRSTTWYVEYTEGPDGKTLAKIRKLN